MSDVSPRKDTAVDVVKSARKDTAVDVVKSVLVVPIVMAIVVGTAWGLVQVAGWRLGKSRRPDPRPAELSPDGSLVLGIPFAEVKGEIEYEGGRRPSLGNWKHDTDSISWRFRVEKPGRYAIDLDVVCEPAGDGSELEVELGGKNLAAAVEPAAKPSATQTIRAGPVDISSAGWTDLRVRAVAIPEETELKLRGVKLVPLAKS